MIAPVKSSKTDAKVFSGSSIHLRIVWRFLILTLALISTLVPHRAFAHDGRPIIVNTAQRTMADKHFLVDVTLHIPDGSDLKNRPTLSLPDFCVKMTENGFKAPNKYVQRTQHDCGQSLGAQSVDLIFPGLNPDERSAVFTVRYFSADQKLEGVYTKVIAPGTTRWSVPDKANFWGVARDYIWLGMTHIWKGLDHLLFIVCLVVIAGSGKRIISAITGFTLAHSITLILSALGVITLSIGAIEALIALSIMLLAVEIIRGMSGELKKDTLVWQYPILVASLFGLIHGLGFASVLSEIGLPEMFEAQGLIFFNVGVEIGQIIFIAALLASLVLCKPLLQKLPPLQAKALALVPVHGIGLICSVWFFERSFDTLFS